MINRRFPYLLHHLLDYSADAFPDEEAVVDGEARFSYRQLQEAAAAGAAVLGLGGFERRDRVAIYLDRGFHHAAAIFAASMAQGAFVPVNPLLKPWQVQHILNDCAARALVTTAQRWEDLRPLADELPTVQDVLLIDEGFEDGRLHSNAFDGAPRSRSDDRAVGEDLAAIMYTSGSTGRPKGVMLNHCNLLAGSRIVSGYLSLTPRDRLLGLLPFSFDYGLNQLISAVDNGATIVPFSFRFGDDIIRVLERERITGLPGVPAVWAILTRAAPLAATTSLPELRYLTNTGGAVPSSTVSRLVTLFPQARLYLMYGLTEAFRSTFLDPEEIERRPTSVGKAIPECEVFLVDPQTGRPCGPEEPGHLIHRGPTVAMGYWNRPEDTARAFRRNPAIDEREGSDVVCYSGDLMRMDDEGFLYFVARDDAMIKSAGYRISPTEVEEVLNQSGRVREVAVIGIPDSHAGERVHAVAVAVDDPPADPLETLAYCAGALPGYMVPRELEWVPALPKTPNGKVDYRALRAARARA